MIEPRYPQGTPEYDAYFAQLKALLSDPVAVAEWVDSFPPVDPNQAGFGK